jgi:hypothetical protein
MSSQEMQNELIKNNSPYITNRSIYNNKDHVCNHVRNL